MSNAAAIRDVPPEILQEQTRSDALYVRLAREMAMDHYEPQELLRRHNLTPQQFADITSSRRFTRLLQSELEAWNSAGNAVSRVRFKALSVIEEFMLDAYKLLLSPDETLNAKARLLDSLVEIAGVKAPEDAGGASVESLSININIGDAADGAPLAPGRLIDGQLVLEAKKEKEARDAVLDDDNNLPMENWGGFEDDESEEDIGSTNTVLKEFTEALHRSLEDDMAEAPHTPKIEKINTPSMVEKLQAAFDTSRTYPAADVPQPKPSDPWGEDDDAH